MDDEEPPPGRDAKFSWEVIRDNSIFTYRIDLVPAYAEVMAALQVFGRGIIVPSGENSKEKQSTD